MSSWAHQCVKRQTLYNDVSILELETSDNLVFLFIAQ